MTTRPTIRDSCFRNPHEIRNDTTTHDSLHAAQIADMIILPNYAGPCVEVEGPERFGSDYK